MAEGDPEVISSLTSAERDLALRWLAANRPEAFAALIADVQAKRERRAAWLAEAAELAGQWEGAEESGD